MRTPMTEEDQEACELLTETQYSQKLTRWETDFILDISEYDTLSEKQREVFEQICERVLR